MPARLAITIVNSTGSAGLVRWNWKPALKARNLSSSLASADSAIAGIDLDAATPRAASRLRSQHNAV
jgi:hypothetical protein